MITNGFLPYLPRDIAGWRFEHRNAYVDLQLRARFAPGQETVQGASLNLAPGELVFSVREAARWWGMGDKAVRVFMAFLEDEGLVAYPEGKEHRRPYVLELTDWWGARKGASEDASKGELRSSTDNNLRGEGAQAGAQGRAQAGASYREEKEEGKEEYTDPVPKGTGAEPGADAPPELGFTGWSEAPPDEEPPVVDADGHLSAGEIVAAWLQTRTVRPPGWAIAKNGKVAQRLAERSTAGEVAAAFLGIGQIFPFSKGKAWDLFDLEKHFANAVEEARNHPEFKRAEQEAEFYALVNQRGAA